MLFNSWQYLLFLPLVSALYFALPYRFRCGMLLLASYFFYMSWKPGYILLILFSTTLDWWAALLIEDAKSVRVKKVLIWVSVIVNMGFLGFFKYYGFFNESVSALLGMAGGHYEYTKLDLILPVGISFYTFQSLSYTLDVYFGRMKADRSYFRFALFVAFFPHMVAGPIVRPTKLLPQFYRDHDFDTDRAVRGLRLILWGLFKKTVIADRLAIFVNAAYNHPTEQSNLTLLVATFFFAFQIFCDFSGYSDIALGSAKVIGYDLTVNFDKPYWSKSVGEFWRRWHISLSTWFKDYLYIPLGGNRGSRIKWLRNIVIVFLVSGLWHGANWTFVVWGALHGFYLVVEILSEKFRNRWTTRLGLSKFPRFQAGYQRVITFSLVCFAWIFFRANHVQDGIYIATHMPLGFLELDQFGKLLKVAASNFGMNVVDLYKSFLLIGLLEGVHFLMSEEPKVSRWMEPKPIFFRWAFYILIAALILNYGVRTQVPFIYFQF